MLNRALPIGALFAHFEKFEKGHNSFKAQQLFMGDNPNWFQVHQLKTVRGGEFIRI